MGCLWAAHGGVLVMDWSWIGGIDLRAEILFLTHTRESHIGRRMILSPCRSCSSPIVNKKI